MKKAFFLNFVFLLLIHFFSQNVFCQEKYTTDKKSAIKNYNEGLIYYTSRNYYKAIELFTRAIKNDSNFIEPYILLGQSYEEIGFRQQAISAYSYALKLNPSFYPYGHIKVGYLLIKEGKYEEALKHFENYFKLNTKDEYYDRKAKRGLENCKFAIEAIKNPVSFKPINVGSSINTEDDEYWPCLTADGQTLIFTRLIKDSAALSGKQEDLFYSEFDGNNYGPSINIGKPLNTRQNEGAQTISANGRIMVFTGCNRKDGYGRCDLYISYKIGNRWSTPKNMGPPVNTKYTETQPSLSADGRTLYFVSDRPGGKGSTDIYITTMKDDSTWSEPIPIGEPINTEESEMSPFIHADNQTLYFASDGHAGLGGFDLFVSYKINDSTWSKPKNLGYPINTSADEIGFIVNAQGNIAFFSSEREKNRGKDIYMLELYKEIQPLPTSYMKGKIYDKYTHKPLKARFELYDLSNGKLIYASTSDPITGEFLVTLPANRNYMLNASANGYLFYSENFQFTDIHDIKKPFIKDVPMNPIEVGETIVLNNIFFEFNSYELKNESILELDKVVDLLKKNPRVKILISGHTDNIGTQEYNKKLSEKRAEAVANYLKSKTIDASRLKVIGYGDTRPISTNETEEGRASNRRTEITILEK